MRVISKKHFKKDNGFTGQDILVSIFITLMFLSLISGIFINLSNTSFEIQKTVEVTKALTAVAEKIDTMGYDEIEVAQDEKPIKELSGFENFELPKKVEIFYQVNEELEDGNRLKEIKVISKYSNTKASNQVDFCIYKRLIDNSQSGQNAGTTTQQAASTSTYASPSTYAAVTPYADTEKSDYPFNKPEVPAGYMPVKFVWTEVNTDTKKGYWVKTTEDDKEWYSIEEGIYPTFVAEGETVRWPFNINGKERTYNVIHLDMAGTFEMKTWMPKIVGNTTNFGYAYQNTARKYYPLTSGGYGVESNNTQNDIYITYERNRKWNSISIQTNKI